MRRLRAGILALALAATPAAAQEWLAAATPEARFVDAAPRGPSASERLTEIRRRIQAAVVYPALARHHRLEGITLVRFEIGRDGTPHQIEVNRSSGAPTLDRAASKAVRRAAPLPWVYGRLEVPVRFSLDDRQ